MSYETIFLSNNGTNIFTTLGFLKKIEGKVDRVKYWNVCGISSLIIFLKIVGKNFEQIFDIMRDFSLIPTFINGSSLVPENEKEKKNYIREWLIEYLSDSEFFSKDIRLGEIYKKTNLFPSFIVWSRNKREIQKINPDNTPKHKLVDAVMACLCYIGVFEEYEYLGETYSNMSSIDSYPYPHMIGESALLIGCISKYDKPADQFGGLGPLSKKEGMLIHQFAEHERYRIENISKIMNSEEFVKLYSFYRRGKINHEALKTLYKLGLEQGSAFLEKKDTEEKKKEFIEKVEAQS